jgi:hypothetical protein
MMDPHLTERALEALAHDRADLAEGFERSHLARCPECQAQVAELRAESHDLSAALRSELSLDLDFDLSGMVSAAMLSALEPEVEHVTALAPARAPLQAELQVEPMPGFTAPSRASWAGAAGLGLLVAATAGLGARPELSLPSVGGAVDLLKVARTVFEAVDNSLVSRLPGGWGFVMLVSLCLFSLLLVPLSRLVTRGVRHQGMPLATLTGLLLCLSVSSSAHALEFEGDFNERQLVNLDVTQKPASEALRRLAASAGLGLVATLPDDPTVSVRVRQAPLRDVISAVLGDAPLLVKREGKLLVVRPLAATTSAPGAPSEPSAPAEPGAPTAATRPVPPVPGMPSFSGAPLPPTPPTPPMPPEPPSKAKRRPSDRVTFGGSTIVRKGERVKDVVTLGGHAVVQGIVEGDVVVFGGSVEIEDGAEVFGELVAVGGSISTDPGAIIHNGATVRTGPAADKVIGRHIDDAFDRHIDKLGDDDDDDDDDAADAAEAAREAAEDAKEAAREAAEDAREAAEDDDDHGTGTVVVNGDGDGGDRDSEQEEGWLSNTLSSLSRHALLFVLGLVLLGAFPRRMRAVTQTIVESPLRAGAVGLVATVAAVVLCVLLLVTIIGIPAAIVLALGSALAGYVGIAASALVVGGLLPWEKLRGHPIRQLGAGVFLLFLTARVPAIGEIALVVACAVGLGAIVRTRFAEPPIVPPATDVTPPPPPPVDPLGQGGGQPNIEIV